MDSNLTSLGLSLIGVNEILAITGDPSKVGHLPGATNVYDVNSKGLTELALRFNKGVNTDGDTLKVATQFNIAGGFDPHVSNIKAAVRKMETKIKSGMHYFITQPVFTKEKLSRFTKRQSISMSLFSLGLCRLRVTKNALFLHHEVPGIKMSDDVLAQFEAVANDRQATYELSLSLANHLSTPSIRISMVFI